MDRRFFCLLAAGCWLSVSGVASALTPEQVKPLAEDDFEAKAQALDQIVAAGDEAAKRILEALRDERSTQTMLVNS
jgi:hypothetical protein